MMSTLQESALVRRPDVKRSREFLGRQVFTVDVKN